MKALICMIIGSMFLISCGMPLPVKLGAGQLKFSVDIGDDLTKNNTLYINSNKPQNVIAVFHGIVIKTPERGTLGEVCIEGTFTKLQACYNKITSAVSFGKSVQKFQHIGQFENQMEFFITSKSDSSTKKDPRNLGMLIPIHKIDVDKLKIDLKRPSRPITRTPLKDSLDSFRGR